MPRPDSDDLRQAFKALASGTGLSVDSVTPTRMAQLLSPALQELAELLVHADDLGAIAWQQQLLMVVLQQKHAPAK